MELPWTPPRHHATTLLQLYMTTQMRSFHYLRRPVYSLKGLLFYTGFNRKSYPFSHLAVSLLQTRVPDTAGTTTCNHHWRGIKAQKFSHCTCLQRVGHTRNRTSHCSGTRVRWPVIIRCFGTDRGRAHGRHRTILPGGTGDLLQYLLSAQHLTPYVNVV